MEYRIEGNPDYGQLTVDLAPGDTFIAEGGAMAWMDDGMAVNGRLMGGFLRAAIRRVVASESLFVGEYYGIPAAAAPRSRRPYRGPCSTAPCMATHSS